jgi:hypothetical protein
MTVSRMTVRRLRSGELVALAGAVCVIVSLTALSWYSAPSGRIDAWDSFGPAVVLLILAAAIALALGFATITERSPAAPVASAIWSIPIGAVAVVAAVVRLLERPQGASAVCAGAWLAFAGALLITAGGWQSIRDERRERYLPADAPPRPPPAP